MSESLHVACPGCDTLNRLPRRRLGQAGKCGRCGSPLFQGTPLVLDAHRFVAHTERSDLPLLIDFCGLM